MGTRLGKKAIQVAAPEIQRDPRASERTFAGIHKLLESGSFESIEEVNEFLASTDLNDIESRAETPAEEAQEIMYQAFDAVGKKRVKLAQSALEIYPDCADAYVLLAEQAATIEEAISLYEKAVEAGRRSLPPEMFTWNQGGFWSWLPSRPFMRAKAGLAYTLMGAERVGEAIDVFFEMLRLNPNDNQGVRYDLVGCLLAEGRDEECSRVLADYNEDPSAIWQYARALMTYRKFGPGDEAAEAMEAAFEANPHVVLLLLLGEFPDEPDTYGFGDESEAAVIIHIMAQAWMNPSDYVPWMLDPIIEHLEAHRPRKRRR